MSENRHVQPSDLQSVSRLVIDAIVGVTDVVEAMHARVARLPGAPRAAGPERARGISGLAYGSVRAVTGGVGRALDAAFGRLTPLLGATESTAEREMVVAAVNGVLGDYLEETDSPLAVPMRLRRHGRALAPERGALDAAIEAPSPRVLVSIHGLCRNDLQWRPPGAEPIDALAGELGLTAVDLHYNSGRHVSANGRDLAELLETLAEQWPVPLESLTIVSHSMGGLVARSACHQAVEASLRWPAQLRDLVTIATPHHGAPLERGGNWVTRILGASPYAAPLARFGKVRSAGITDLRYGNLVDEDWAGRDRFDGGGDRRRTISLPAGTRCFAIAGTRAPGSGDPGEKGRRLQGDGLVPLDSALGRHPDPDRDLRFPESRQSVVSGVGHVELATHAETWKEIRRWLTAGRAHDSA